MKHDEFKIGTEFTVGDGVQRWRCTDIGTRVIVAICISDHDETWHKGPPYAVAEEVFDENDLPACEPVVEEGRTQVVF